jgi:hypothetical protein
MLDNSEKKCSKVVLQTLSWKFIYKDCMILLLPTQKNASNVNQSYITTVAEMLELLHNSVQVLDHLEGVPLNVSVF